jgi:UDP-N-acetylglucosamine diphosphorylase / glucose-1-phosphate thymidylyltransferase / UDP-N-acetylgalactosamine diphosphorylase / glucosamine-1-phosphate N-acetyltransferase / galactosamine-1-phosphate N-acetyltransferase
MQCVVLAAGLGKRMRPLTDERPKPLVEVCGKTLLDHIVEALPSAIDELIMIVGYRGDMIEAHCGTLFHGRKVSYLVQEEQRGTADALWLAKDLLKGRFMVMFADDIHGKDDLAEAVSYSRAILSTTSQNPERFGVIVKNADGTLAEIVEKPQRPPSNLVSTGPMVLDTNVFHFEPQQLVNGEYYLPEVVNRYVQKYPIAVVEQKQWIAIGYPDDIIKAEAILCPKQ